MTEQLPSDQSTASLQTVSDPVVLARMANKRYPDIARELGVSEALARYRVKRAVKQGLITPRQAHYSPRPSRGPNLTLEAYNARWLARIKTMVIIDEKGCWLFQGRFQKKGYGQICYRGHSTNAHRAMYMVTHGVVLDGNNELVCHSCDVRHCINPDHLWLGTAKDNNRDCGNKGRHHNGVKTHCKRGHEFTFENTAFKHGPGTVMRVCKECQRLRMKSPQYRERANERQRRKREAKRLQMNGEVGR